MVKPVDKQVLEKNTLTIEDVKEFVADAKEKKRNWQITAERSWREIKKRNDRNKLYGGNNLDVPRRWSKFPLWWSTLKIRQPITFARLPFPSLRDDSDDDTYGRTACVVGERLVNSIIKTFEPFDEFAACNDDFLVTNFGWGRWFYRVETSTEDQKERLQVIQPPPPPPVGPGQPPPQPQPPMVVDAQGQQVQQYEMDEDGPFIVTGQVQVDNEEVYFEHGLYSMLYVDPQATKWSKVCKLAIETPYTYQEFKDKFGTAALETIATKDISDHKSGKKPINVFEYHDDYYKEVRWFAENSEDFFQPSDMSDSEVDSPDDIETEVKDNSDLYGLTGFFPLVKPLIINSSTDEFWPTPEYFQINDILDDTNGIVQRMMLLTKAIRVRFLFDKSVPELKGLIQEIGEAGGLGVTNLAATLANGGGDLSKLVAYFPVAEMIEGLQNMYTAFNQRLDMYYQITGLSSLIRGQTPDDGTQKTFGERQMEGKFALNQMEPFQRKLQDWIKNNYQLGMEMALKMFDDKTLDRYIVPATLDDEHKQRYVVALELLRENKRSRFRVDFETDSTISINQQWRQQQAIQMADTVTKMQESIVQTIQFTPELAESQIKVMQHVVGELTDGNLFADELIDGLEQLMSDWKTSPPFNRYAAQNQLDQQKIILDDKFKHLQLKANTSLEQAKNSILAQKAQFDNLRAQATQLKTQVDAGVSQQELQNAVVKLQADIAQGWESLNIQKENMLLIAQTEGGKQSVDSFKAQIDARTKDQEIQLQQASQLIDAHEAALSSRDFESSLQERWATEQRLQAEHEVNTTATNVDTATNLLEALKPTPIAPTPSAPINVDKSLTVHVKPQAPIAPKVKPKKQKP